MVVVVLVVQRRLASAIGNHRGNLPCRDEKLLDTFQRQTKRKKEEKMNVGMVPVSGICIVDLWFLSFSIRGCRREESESFTLKVRVSGSGRLFTSANQLGLTIRSECM